MSDVVKRRVRSLVEAIGPSPFSGRRAGIEKESLRIDRAGYISQRPHPEALGSALTHPTITTDFSEALLEFITPAYRGVREVSRSLRHLHRFTCPLIGDEVLWAASMPCMVTGDRSIHPAWRRPRPQRRDSDWPDGNKIMAAACFATPGRSTQPVENVLAARVESGKQLAIVTAEFLQDVLVVEILVLVQEAARPGVIPLEMREDG